MDDAARILAGRYEVGELIGRGGMAEVHIGHDTRLGRTVAIKILRSDLARDPSFQARFRREAQSAAALNHPAIVAVYDTGEDELVDATGAVSHVPFIVMEYVEGHTVRDILRDGNAVPIDEAIEITMGVLAALDYSHHAGIVHRDIKPANVMLTPTGAVKVMDFGIARAVADSAATMTQTQAVIGTAQYLSPEQARGETVDARSDLYSTGCLLFEMLTGRPPFIGDSPVAVAYQHVREAAPAPSTFASDVPETLDRITLKALAKDRESRYSNASEFRSDLDAALHGGRVSAPAVGLLGAGVLDPAGAATQVMDPAAGATQVVPAAAGAPWSPMGAGPATATMPPARQPGAHREEDPDEEEPRSRRALMWTLIGVGVLAVAAIVTLLVLANNRGSETPRTVSLIDLSGRSEEAAAQWLRDNGLTPGRAEEPSTEIDSGLIIRTDPAASTDVPVNSTVTLVVSTGPASATVPDVRGYTQELATEELEKAGLEIQRVDQDNDPEVEKNRVTRTDPAAGTSVSQGSSVIVYISSGYVDLTDLTGKSEADARAELSKLRLTASIEKQETTDPTQVGKVIEQSPGAGAVAQGSAVTLTIGIAAPPSPTPPPPTPTETTPPPTESAAPPTTSTDGSNPSNP